MILMHVAYGLDLIALGVGGGLLAWGMKTPGGSMIGKLIGTAVVVLSIISMICIYSCAMKGSECHKSPMGATMEQGADTTAPDQGTPAPKKEHHHAKS